MSISLSFTFFEELPTEILSHIFKLQVDHLNTYRTPLVLGGVCRLWRNVAWQTPSLWTHIHFVIKQTVWKRRLKFAPRNQLLKEWIERSGGLLLNLIVQIEGRKPGSPAEEEELQLLIDIINCCSPRWRQLWLTMPPWMQARITGDLSCSSSAAGMPHLQILYFASGECSQAIELPQSLYLALHNLVELNLPSGHLALQDSERPWMNLQILSVKRCTLEDVVEYLRHAPNLRQATFDELQKDAAQAAVHVYHASLEMLKIDFNHLHQRLNNDSLFETLSLPKIKDLSVNKLPSSPKVILDMLKRSGASVEVLQLDDARWPVDELVDFLGSQSKTLKRLSLKQMGNSSTVPELLIAIFNSLHMLEHFVFSLHSRGNYELTQGWKFLDHIPLPTTGRSTLTTLSIQLSMGDLDKVTLLSPPTFKRMLLLRDAGLKAELFVTITNWGGFDIIKWSIEEWESGAGYVDI